MQLQSELNRQLTYDSAASRYAFVTELQELWRYRYLLANLISRNLKVRYKRSWLGFAWAMLNPLLTMAVLATVFTAMFRFEVDNYPIYVLAGLLLWNFFSQSTALSMVSITNSSVVLTKIYVPASVFVIAAVGSAFVNLLYAAGPLLVIALVSGVQPTVHWLLVLIPMLQTLMFALGVGFILATLAVYFQDIADIYQVLLNAYFYLSPIIYPVSLLPAFLQDAQRYNPLYHLLINTRAPLLDGTLPPASSLLVGTLFPLALLLIGWGLFTRYKHQFVYHL